MIRMNNSCDCSHTINVHFTKACPHNCAYCVDKLSIDKSPIIPNIDEMFNTVKDLINTSPFGTYEDVLIVGGEPLMYMDDLLSFVKRIKEETDLLVYVTTSLPEEIQYKLNSLGELLSMVDGLNISIQHPNPVFAMYMLNTKPRYPESNMLYRQSIIQYLEKHPDKKKVRINLNIMKPLLSDKKSVVEALEEIDTWGFGSIKLSELQQASEYYVNIEKLYNIKLPSPYSYGCNIKAPDEIQYGINTPIYLKRSCFMVENSLKASLKDGIKAIHKKLHKNDNHFVAIYEDGHIERRWK